LLDGDSSSTKSKEKYEKEFNDFIKGRIFTLKYILNLKVAMEGLIEEDDKKTIYEAVYGKSTFDKMKSNKKRLKENLNYAINQLLLQKKPMNIRKETKKNFKTLLKFIKSKQ